MGVISVVALLITLLINLQVGRASAGFHEPALGIRGRLFAGFVLLERAVFMGFQWVLQCSSQADIKV